jgi:hypothetical protein
MLNGEITHRSLTVAARLGQLRGARLRVGQLRLGSLLILEAGGVFD